MTHERPPDLDRRLRDAFPRDTHAVARVVRVALAAETRRSLLKRVAVGAVGAAALVAAISAVWPARPAPGSLDVIPLSGFLTDGVLVISLPDGSVSISDEGTRDSRPPDGYGIVLVEGDSR